MPDRIKLKSQDLVKGLANTVLHSEVICIELCKCITHNKKKMSELQCSHLEVIQFILFQNYRMVYFAKKPL